MKKLLLFAMLLIGVSTYAQTELRLETEMDLTECNILVFDDDGNHYPMNDMRVYGKTEISIFLDPGTHYVIQIDNQYYVDVFFVEELDLDEPLYAHIEYDSMRDATAIFEPQNELIYMALSESGSSKKAIRKQKRLNKRKAKNKYHF